MKLFNVEMLKNKKIAAVAVVLILLIAGGLIMRVRSGSEKQATLDEILSISSERKEDPGAVLVPYNAKEYMLSATPMALYYKGSEKTAIPLLTVGHNPVTPETGTSKSVRNFLTAYSPSNVMALGLDPGMISETGATPFWESNAGLERDTLAAMEKLWIRSDAVILVENTPEGYEIGVGAASIASYLNIPLLVTDRVTTSMEASFQNLGVKYTIVCGDIGGYGKVWRLSNTQEVLELLTLGSDADSRSVLKNRVGITPSYIVLANPMDAFHPRVVENFSETFTGEVISQHTGSTSFPTADAGATPHYITIPEDYIYANVIIDSKVDFTDGPLGDPDLEGQRSYTYFGIDANRDGNMVDDPNSPEDLIHFMVPSLGYDNIRDASGRAIQGWGYSEKPIYRSTGEKIISMVATLHDGGERHARGLTPITTTYSITVTVEKLDGPNYPLMPSLSGMASYLATYRGGVVLAQSSFGLHSGSIPLMNNSGDPSVNEDLIDQNNIQVFNVKNQLNKLVSDIRGLPESPTALAKAMGESNETMFVGIIADTNMVPQFIFPSNGQIYGQWQGYGVASDNAYADIDLDREFPPYSLTEGEPSMEMAVGRIVGWDTQDVSALISRTFFYNDIIDTFQGHSGQPWKNSALTTFGTSPPVGIAITVTEKLGMAFRQAGFTVDSRHDGPFSDSKLTAPLYEQSNFIYFCAHGFFYWYVPPGLKPTGAGGGFDVVKVKDMNFGPSVIFGSSCVTGKIDGLQPYNALSMSFLHSGMNSYIGASRLSWGGLSLMENSGEAYGDYVALMMYGYMTGFMYDKDGGLTEQAESNLPVGEALMKAKNTFLVIDGTDGGGPKDDTISEFNLHGDPAFNPYEPIHQG